MDIPLVSVIVPNYNHARFLRKRLDSILAQSYKNFELIILDDCSLDNSQEVIELFRHHPKVSQIVYNSQNSGSTFKQWKKGISLAKGDYIWIAESDDFAQELFLETLIKGIEQHSEVSIAFCNSIWIDTSGDIIFTPKTSSIDRTHNGNEFTINRMSKHNDIYNASMVIFRREFFNKIIDQTYLKLKYCGDWYFWILLAEQGTVFESRLLLNYFRRHELSVSYKSNKAGLFFTEGLVVLKKIKSKLNSQKKIDVIRHWAYIFFNSPLQKRTQLYVLAIFSIEFLPFLYFNLRFFFAFYIKKLINAIRHATIFFQ